MTLIIRSWQKDDIDEINKLFLSDGAETLCDFKTMIDYPQYSGIVVEYEEIIVGYALIIFYQTTRHGPIAKAEDILVHKDHRGNGFGNHLVRRIKEIGKKAKVNQIALTSRKSRHVARELYVSHGFKLHETGLFILKL